VTPQAASGGPGVRAAGADDLPALAASLAAAFDGYAWTRWTVDGRDHARRLRELYAIYLGVALRFGEVWMAEDASGAAAWTRSDTRSAQAEHLHAEGLDAEIGRLMGDRAEAGAAAEGLVAPHRAAGPHWRLEAVGVLPAAQGRGIGRRLVEPVLARCDADRRLAALETSSAENVRLYRRLAFEVHHEVEVPAGPHVWLMRRTPR
jgi:ribosomal protein S18 acetylase RimI-like enzyme